ncbi:unnamed protein product [Camellia sinensis]
MYDVMENITTVIPAPKVLSAFLGFKIIITGDTRMSMLNVVYATTCFLRRLHETIIGVRSMAITEVSSIIFQGALSSALPVLPSTLEEKYPKLPNAQQVFMERELNTNSPSLHSSFLSNSRVVGPMFSSTSGYFNDLYLSSIAPPEKNSRKSPFSTNAGASMPLAPCHSTMLQSVASSKSYSLSTDSFADFFDYPVNTSSRKIQIGSSMNGGCAMATEDLSKQNDWQDWVDLINDDDSLNSDLNVIFVDNIVEDLELKQIIRNNSPKYSSRFQLHLRILLMLLTPHPEQVVVQPKCACVGHLRPLLKQSINLVAVRVSSEKKFTCIEEVASLDLKTGIELTEAIRLQMGVQKPLHEQSEIQRNNLQLRIEEQGRYLLIMFEKQCKASDTLKASSSLFAPHPGKLLC